MFILTIFVYFHHVLIDTWWNVNTLKKLKGLFGLMVLIDTWWNVNDKVYTIYNADGVGFNRYMVECEYTKKLENNKRVFRFNRYMVECE